VRDGSISSFFYLELRLRPDGTLNFERILLPLVCTKIAGAVPTWTSLQVLESEVRASKNAEECPYPVDGRCPHAGTGWYHPRRLSRAWLRSSTTPCGVEGMSGAKSATKRQGALGFSRGSERLSETVQECREARQLL
jgi:creatinine amidohydrolase/Fe(II)-dependent formamide hydrolase-like protein